MSPGTVAVRAGVQRGWIELRQTLAMGEVVGFLWPSVLAVIVLYVLSDRTVPGTDFSLGSQAIPGLLGANVVFTGMLGLTLALITERDDGTLLRAKAVPNGMLGYLTGKVVGQAGMTFATFLIVLVPAAFLFDGLELLSVWSWLTLAWVLVLGLVATLPIGAVTGALFKNLQTETLGTFLIMGLFAISGVFYDDRVPGARRVQPEPAFRTAHRGVLRGARGGRLLDHPLPPAGKPGGLTTPAGPRLRHGHITLFETAKNGDTCP